MKLKLTELVKAHKKRDTVLRDMEKKYEGLQEQLGQQEKANQQLQDQIKNKGKGKLNEIDGEIKHID
jgi:septal ring factor EnvC (AmiA/AmiB activator)